MLNRHVCLSLPQLDCRGRGNFFSEISIVVRVVSFRVGRCPDASTPTHEMWVLVCAFEMHKPCRNCVRHSEMVHHAQMIKYATIESLWRNNDEKRNTFASYLLLISCVSTRLHHHNKGVKNAEYCSHRCGAASHVCC